MNVWITFAFVFQRMKTNAMLDEHEFYVFCVTYEHTYIHMYVYAYLHPHTLFSFSATHPLARHHQHLPWFCSLHFGPNTICNFRSRNHREPSFLLKTNKLCIANKNVPCDGMGWDGNAMWEPLSSYHPEILVALSIIEHWWPLSIASMINGYIGRFSSMLILLCLRLEV